MAYPSELGESLTSVMFFIGLADDHYPGIIWGKKEWHNSVCIPKSR